MKLHRQLRRIISVLILLIAAWLSLPDRAWGLDKTPTGFYYPTGSATWPQTCGIWLGRDPANGGCYVAGVYHIGQDMPIAQGSPVYPISKGTVVKIFTTYQQTVNGVYNPDVYGLGYSNVNGQYVGNSVMFVQHTLQDGTPFLAEYMHVLPTVGEQAQVVVGQTIATVGPYPYDAPHLHFGIHPNINWPTNYWGRMPDSAWGTSNQNNGFVDPADINGTGWIQTKYPQGSGGGVLDPANIYVSLSGSDAGNGGPTAPFRTIKHAIDLASAGGATIYISPGTYGEKNSSSGKKIHFVVNGSGTVRTGG